MLRKTYVAERDTADIRHSLNVSGHGINQATVPAAVIGRHRASVCTTFVANNSCMEPRTFAPTVTASLLHETQSVPEFMLIPSAVDKC